MEQRPSGRLRTGALDALPCLQSIHFLLVGFFCSFADTGSVDLEWSLQGVNKCQLIARWARLWLVTLAAAACLAGVT